MPFITLILPPALAVAMNPAPELKTLFKTTDTF
jgi:hypothetical protein